MVVSSKPEFFDVVRMNDDAKLGEGQGKLGYIAGVSEERGVIYGYAVRVYDFQQVWSVATDDFVLLGYKDELAAADFGKLGSIRVSPRGEVI